MVHPATNPGDWDPTWTGEEILETSAELAEAERLMAEAIGEGPAPENGEPDVELIATLEARAEDEAAAPRSKPTEELEPPEDAETYAVLPELDVLAELAEPGVRDDEPDDRSEVLWFDVVVA